MLTKSTNNSAVKFISYDGRFPCLCAGTLKIEVNGKEYCFRPYGRRQDGISHREFWSSGGGFDSNYSAYTGEWVIDIALLPDELKPYAYDIDRVFNENVEYGCCGGCE